MRLFVNDSNFYETDIAPGPYFVNEGAIQIYPGEEVFISAKLKNGELRDMHVVSSPKDTTKVIRVKLWQTANGRTHEQMMLRITNPFDGELHYQAAMYLLEHKQWAETSTIPVRAGLSAYETWSDIIVTMALSDWKVTSVR